LISISTPGRICLFGEHQDYLGLPVIPLAISLRCKIVGERTSNPIIIINKPDINQTESFSLDNLKYSKSRDYFKSGLKICIKEGLKFNSGLECKLTSNIPIQAGLSSSSAVMVSWIFFLSRIADNPQNWSKDKIGKLAYKAEVLEFLEPGGMMDQYSTAIGGLIYLESTPTVKVNKLKSNLGYFVIGDSQQPKETIKILNRCKNNRIEIINKIIKIDSTFCISTTNFEKIKSFNLSNTEINLLSGTIKNRNFLRLAKLELSKGKINKNYIGILLNNHHSVLRDTLKISTPKIEKLIYASLNAGAKGAKINGSGGGGCMFAYTPNNPEKVLEAIESNGGKGYIVKSDTGTTEIN